MEKVAKIGLWAGLGLRKSFWLGRSGPGRFDRNLLWFYSPGGGLNRANRVAQRRPLLSARDLDDFGGACGRALGDKAVNELVRA